jgi:putative ABC transport system permease protein
LRPDLWWRHLGGPSRACWACSFATAGLGALLAIQAQFHGRAVGTLLGDAVAVEVRAPDVAAVLVTAALAGVGIAHLIGTEIRERATEFAGLRAIGWTEATIARLVVTHAALVALAGAALGAGLAWWFVESAFGGATRPMALAIVGAGGLAVVGAALFALIPARRLRDLGTAFVLAED